MLGPRLERKSLANIAAAYMPCSSANHAEKPSLGGKGRPALAKCGAGKIESGKETGALSGFEGAGIVLRKDGPKLFPDDEKLLVIYRRLRLV